MDEIPAGVATAVRAAASAAPVYPGELEGVYRRAGRRRRRRVVAAFASVLALLAAIAGTSALVRRTTADPKPAGVVARPAQRLFVLPWYDPAPPDPNRPTAGEMLPDGSIVRHPVPAELTYGVEWKGLPDGGMAGVYDDFDRARGTRKELVVVGADGNLRLRRVLTHPAAELVAATSGTVYLWQETVLVAHDLAGGAETVVATRAQLGAGIGDATTGGLLDVAADRVLFGGGVGRCAPVVLDPPAHRITARLKMPIQGCRELNSVRLSPRGDLAAVVAVTGTAWRVVVIRIADDRMLVDRVVSTRMSGATGRDWITLGWQDADTLGVAVLSSAPVPEQRTVGLAHLAIDVG